MGVLVCWGSWRKPANILKMVGSTIEGFVQGSNLCYFVIAYIFILVWSSIVCRHESGSSLVPVQARVYPCCPFIHKTGNGMCLHVETQAWSILCSWLILVYTCYAYADFMNHDSHPVDYFFLNAWVRTARLTRLICRETYSKSQDLFLDAWMLAFSFCSGKHLRMGRVGVSSQLPNRTIPLRWVYLFYLFIFYPEFVESPSRIFLMKCEPWGRS